MTEYTALDDLRFDDKAKFGDDQGFVRRGEKVKLTNEKAKLLLLKGRIEPADLSDVPEPEALPLTIEEIYGKKLADALAVMGFSTWETIQNATKEQLLTVEGIDDDKLAAFKKKILKREG